MVDIFVTRHKGALDWARRKGIDAKPVDQLEAGSVGRGDRVLGTIPVHVAADVIARGARYLHLEMNVPEERRGQELSADEMEACGAELVEYHVERVKTVRERNLRQ